MRRRLLPSGMLLLAGLLALMTIAPVAALDALPGQPAGTSTQLQLADDDGIDTVEAALWTAVGIAVLMVVGGIFYMFKRRIGAFPRDPEWVAPISIMPAGENPVEVEDYPAPPSDHH